jgi:lipoprotein-anchoring transpeptidase ErfK/SrfK
MTSRWVAALAAGLTLITTSAPAQYQYEADERQQMLMGGSPKSRMFSLWSSQAIPKATVNFPGNHKPGTIVIDTAERRLYLVQEGGTAIRYGIGVGRVGFTWKGVRKVTEKKEWPSWTPPPQMLKRQPGLPRFMPGGEDNPLGARAMYLGGTLYRIHGTAEPETIGQAVSSGCFRLTNADVTDLYDRVRIGATVIVQ